MLSEEHFVSCKKRTVGFSCFIFLANVFIFLG